MKSVFAFSFFFLFRAFTAFIDGRVEVPADISQLYCLLCGGRALKSGAFEDASHMPEVFFQTQRQALWRSRRSCRIRT
jgi:hypothetical protein